MQVHKKISEWVQLYLEYVGEKSIEAHVQDDEGYKFKSVEHFQRHFNIDSLNLAENLEQAIIRNNLVVGAQYFPRNMLLLYAQQYPEEVREVLRILFDETRPIDKRLDETKVSFEEIHLKRNKDTGDKAKSSYIGLRFLSLLLGGLTPIY